MEIYILSIGNEILEGSILDTNSNYIAKQLFKEGIKVNGIYALSDDKNNLTEFFKKLIGKETITITSGGLGPTFDDITTESIAEACNKRLKLDKKSYFELLNKIKIKGVKLKLSHLKQIQIPEKARVIRNHYGTAPGIYLKCKNSHIITLPGVPSEMKPMFENEVLPLVKNIYNPEALFSCDIKIIGIAESDVDKFLKTINPKNTEIILNAMEGELAVRVRSKSKEKIEKTKKAFLEKYGFKVFSVNNEKIEDVLANLLDELDFKIGFVESITAGTLAQMMSGKACFLRSLVSNENVKSDILPFETDILAIPCNLSGNEFELKLMIKNDEKNFYLRYLGNINFMRKSVSKRTLGFIFEYIKEHYD